MVPCVWDQDFLCASYLQLPVLVRGKVTEGDLIVANRDGACRAIPRDQVTLGAAVNAVGTAWAAMEPMRSQPLRQTMPPKRLKLKS